MQISKSRLWETIGQMMGVLQQVVRKKEMVWEIIVFKTLSKTIQLSMQFSCICFYLTLTILKGWKDGKYYLAKANQHTHKHTHTLVETWHFIRFKNSKSVYTQWHSFKNIKQNLTN